MIEQQYPQKSGEGEVVGHVALVQYPMSDNQTICVFGGNQEPAELDGHGQVTWTLLGRLDDQSFFLESTTRNSLIRDGWDFEKDPNPFIAVGDHQPVND